MDLIADASSTVRVANGDPMFTEITGSVVDWATSLILNPVVWTGIGLFGVSVLLILVSLPR